MFTFMVGALGGALVSGSYVLLRTKRTGKENQQFVKDFYHTTKANAENVSDKASNVKASVNNLNVEVAKLQTGFMPEMMAIADDFKTEATVYTRRINDGIQDINQEVDLMNARIQAKTDLPEQMNNNNTNQ